MHSNHPIPVAVALACILSPRPAAADTLEATRGQPIVETEHAVDLLVEEGLATFDVTRSFHNRGGITDQLEMEILLPDESTATGLAIKAGKTWYAGELMEAGMADVIYETLTGHGPWKPKDPALLKWGELGELELWVFPVLPQKTSTLAYTLVASPSYRDGYYWISYPVEIDQSALAVPSMKVKATYGKGKVLVNGQAFAQGTSVTVGTPIVAGQEGPVPWCGDVDWSDEWMNGTWDQGGDSSFCLEPGRALVRVPAPQPDTAAVRFGSFDLPTGRSLVRLEIDSARRLRETPKKAGVVFVVDGSRSWGEEGIDAALAFAGAYTRHVPDARVEVVVFRREARRLFGEMVRGADWDARLASVADEDREAGNGSNLESGLALATQILGERKGHRRIVVLTDALMRREFVVEEARDAVLAGEKTPLVHVAEIAPGLPGEECWVKRYDDHDLDPVSRATGGIVLEVYGGATSMDFERASLELVRPLRIDFFEMDDHGSGLADLAGYPDELPEGRGARWFLVMDGDPGALTLRGEIWSTPWEMEVERDPEWGTDIVPALAFGSYIHEELDEIEMMAAATSAGAVSPVTSYLAIEPGVRPSTDGFAEEANFGFGGLGLMGTGSGGGGCVGGYAVEVPDWEGMLTELVRAAAAGCVPEGTEAEVQVRVECTYAEVVDVEIALPDDPVVETCVREAAWSVTLPDAFTRDRFESTIDVS